MSPGHRKTFIADAGESRSSARVPSTAAASLCTLRRRPCSPREWFNRKIRQVALSDFEHNNLFEFRVMLAWLQFKPPAIVCLSEQGIFTHKEIDQ